MQIVFAASEMSPFAKTGGLADVVGVLPREIAALGHQVKVILPRYRSIDLQKFAIKKIADFEISLGHGTEKASVRSHASPSGVEIYFVDHPAFFDREGLYGTSLADYPDNDRRFIFFARAVFELLKRLGVGPDILHCHDWQTGLVPAYQKLIYEKEILFETTKTVFTIHNLAYQGNFPPDTLALSGLGWEEFTLHRLEFFGHFSFLKAGLVYSDLLTTVSPRYAREIQTEEFGCGLDGVLRERTSDLFGILNGIDPEEWDPKTDKDLVSNFSASTLGKKLINKGLLQKETFLAVDPDVPVIGMVTRLADQKGLDLVLQILEDLAQRKVQLVLLGNGDNKYHSALTSLAKKFAGRFSFNLRFDERLARRIYGGSDFFLMPSIFEPCGLGQMIALRYGTAPIVREVGGLADTVTQFDPRSGKGNGFVFREKTPKALLSKIDEAIQVYRSRELWEKLEKNAMNCDFSWKASAKKYVELYKTAERKTALR